MAGSSLAAVRPTLRRLARWRRSSLLLRMGMVVLAAVGLAAGGLEAAIALVAAREPAHQQALATSRNWTEINHPIAVYDLAGTDFAKLPLVYRARRHRPDDAREDVLTFGSLGTRNPYLQLSLLRRAAPAERHASADLSDDLARLAGDRNATVSRIRTSAPVDTRFGTVEAADLLLWEAGSATPCLGFRGPVGGGDVLRVAGFACGSPGRPLGRAALACAIDRIDLLSARDDGPLRAVFVAAERRAGSACGSGAGSQALISMDLPGVSGPAMAGHRAAWLDPEGDMPPLRGAVEVKLRQR